MINTEEMFTFSNRLRELRKARGLSQEVAAELINVDRGTYSKYETCKQFPRVDVLNRICDTLECDAGYLCGQYDYEYRSIPDVMNETNLSESAALFLTVNKASPYIMSVINYLLENPALLRDMTDYIFQPNGGKHADDYNYMKFKLTEDVISFADDMKLEYSD